MLRYNGGQPDRRIPVVQPRLEHHGVRRPAAHHPGLLRPRGGCPRHERQRERTAEATVSEAGDHPDHSVRHLLHPLPRVPLSQPAGLHLITYYCS